MTELTADKMLSDGFAMARTDKGIVFVEGLLPGETGIVERNGKKGGIPFFKTTEVTTASEHRREPVCDKFGRCGGCNWLHMDYNFQVESKREILFDLMSRVGKIQDFPEPEIFTADEYAYRQRVQFKIDAKYGAVGFFQRNSNTVVSIDHCPLLTEPLNDLLKDKKAILSAKGKKRGVMVLDTGNGLLASPSIDEKTEFCGNMKAGEFTFQLQGNSFFQSNRYLTETMGSWCFEDLQGDRLLDLFGGVGLFSLFHGKKFRETVLVEQSQAMAESAEKGFRANGLNTGSALGMKSEAFFKSRHAKNFDTVIVDPPRTGLTPEVLDGVVTIAPKQILYISCNPATQARDLGYWVNKKGYKIAKTAIFDLYPNSSHMETGVLLVRGEK